MRGTKPHLRIERDGLQDMPAPDWLPADARAEWERIVPILARRKILTEADLGMVEGFCLAAGLVREMQRDIAQHGAIQRIFKIDGKGNVLLVGMRKNPAVTIQSEAMTRAEAARLLRAAAPHLRRFIVLSLYTGRRATAVLDLTWTRVDLDGGVIRFRPEGEAETNKRRGRCRIARQLGVHLRIWHRKRRDTHLVTFRGESLASTKKAVRRAGERAGIEGVTPHVPKHTAITWAMMGGRLTIEGAAEFFDTSPATIRRTYWHHSPHHQDEGLAAVERRK